MTTTELSTKYNNASTGLFKTGQNRGIGSDDLRSLITDVIATFGDVFLFSNSVLLTTGTNSFSGSTPVAILEYTSGMKVFVRFTNASTGNSTLNLSAVGAKKIFINPTVQASAGDIVAGQVYLLSYQSDLDSSAGGWLIIGGSIWRSINPWRGAFDASVDAYPSSGGSGTAGAIQSGDEWYVSVSGDIDVNGLGVITVNIGAIIKALVDSPGTTPANWRVIQ